MTAAIQTWGLSKRYGNVLAVDAVDLRYGLTAERYTGSLALMALAAYFGSLPARA
jgi:hypothetical protein